MSHSGGTKIKLPKTIKAQGAVKHVRGKTKHTVMFDDFDDEVPIVRILKFNEHIWLCGNQEMEKDVILRKMAEMANDRSRTVCSWIDETFVVAYPKCTFESLCADYRLRRGMEDNVVKVSRKEHNYMIEKMTEQTRMINLMAHRLSQNTLITQEEVVGVFESKAKVNKTPS